MRSRIATVALASALALPACKDEAEAPPEASSAVSELQKRALELAAKAEQAAKEAEKAAAEDHGAEGGGGSGVAGAPKSLQEGLAKFEAAMKGSITNEVEPVGFRDLKALLPESLDTLERVDVGGEKTGAAGVKVSMAHAKFKSKDGGQLTLKVTDMGSMKGFAALAATGWMSVEIDKESSAGYEKTGDFEGYRSFEKFRTAGSRGELKMVIGNRFMVEARGRKLPMETVKGAAKQIDLSKLESMKDQGVKKIDRTE